MTNEEAFDAARLTRREAKEKCIEAKAKEKEAFDQMNAARGQERQQLEKAYEQIRNAAANAAGDLQQAIREETSALERERNRM